VVGTEDSEVDLVLTLRNPNDAEIGLLVLLLKDLWTGDLPIGGESGVGRGRLRGRHAKLTLANHVWEIEEKTDGSLQVTPDQAGLERFAEAFNERMDGAR
jgi:hypothetical protein